MPNRTEAEVRAYNEQWATIRIPRRLKERLKVEASRRDLNQSVLAERAIDRALTAWEADEL